MVLLAPGCQSWQNKNKGQAPKNKLKEGEATEKPMTLCSGHKSTEMQMVGGWMNLHRNFLNGKFLFLNSAHNVWFWLLLDVGSLGTWILNWPCAISPFLWHASSNGYSCGKAASMNPLSYWFVKFLPKAELVLLSQTVLPRFLDVFVLSGTTDPSLCTCSLHIQAQLWCHHRNSSCIVPSFAAEWKLTLTYLLMECLAAYIFFFLVHKRYLPQASDSKWVCQVRA